MKAAAGRKLKIGDWVKVSLGTHPKTCEIIAINWPTFTVKCKDYRGNEMIRTIKYRSIWRKVEPNAVSTISSPSWLIWPAENPQME